MNVVNKAGAAAADKAVNKASAAANKTVNKAATVATNAIVG